MQALSAGGGNLGLLAQQALELRVETVAVASSAAEAELVERLKAEAGDRGRGASPLPQVISGPEANTHLASLSCDSVLNGITGAVGLAPTLAALEAGSRLILANKESLIVGGPLVKRRAKPGQIIPVGSEHSALFQCLQGDKKEAVRRMVLTASGGPFHGRTRAQMADVTREEVVGGRRALDELRTRAGEFEADLALGLLDRDARLEAVRPAASDAMPPGLDQTRTVELIARAGTLHRAEPDRP